MSGLICVAGGKGAPGATTFALAMALAAKATGPVMLVDADPDGGDLASMLEVSSSPGLMSLATATRHGFDPRELHRHSQAVAPDFDVLASPASSEQATSSLKSLGPLFASLMTQASTIADVGRWSPHSPSADLIARSMATVLVIHPTVSGVAHARYQLDDLSSRCPHVVVVCAGDRPYAADEVASTLGIDLAIAAPIDRRGAALIARAPSADRWLRRSPLMRSAGALLEILNTTDDLVEMVAS